MSDDTTSDGTAAAVVTEPEADAEAADTAFKERLELIIAVMLGLAAIITAWTAFQSSQLGDKVQENFSEGIRISDQASQAYNIAFVQDAQDQALFLEFAKAARDDEETAAYILEHLMSPELAKAVGWWADQPLETGPDSPFVPENPEWSDQIWLEADELDAQAIQLFDAAKQADEDGDEFDLLTVVVSLALFLFGVASLVRQRRIMIGLAVLGGIVLVYSIVRTLTLGDPAGLF